MIQILYSGSSAIEGYLLIINLQIDKVLFCTRMWKYIPTLHHSDVGTLFLHILHTLISFIEEPIIFIFDIMCITIITQSIVLQINVDRDKQKKHTY